MPQLTIPFLAFSAGAVLVYWLIPTSWRDFFLAISGSGFFAILDPISFGILCLLTVMIFFWSRKPATAAGLFLVVPGLVLFLCFTRLAPLIQARFQMRLVIVLLGLGFYLLKLIHYWVEMRANSFRPHRFLDFYNFMIFFPTITIGPINRFEDFLRSGRRNRWDSTLFAAGLERILYGYVKVIVLANWLIAIRLLSLVSRLRPESEGLSIVLDSLVYGLYLYFAFAGFSDIAIGLSNLFGYEMCENFDYPFLKSNIGEFWQSWHMSLSSWCRQYVFLPTFAKWRSLALALLTTMIAIGLWHEFSTRFLLWGLYHGTGILIWRWYQSRLLTVFPRTENRLWKWAGTAFSTALTFTFVIVGFTIPRSSSFAEIAHNFQLIIGF